MKTSLAKDRSYVKWHTHRSLSWSMGLGFHWFTTRYLPSLERLAKANYQEDHVLLGNSYCLIGDIHLLIECPLAAIRAYKKSLEFNPYHEGALYYLGELYKELGKYRKALDCYKKLLEIDSEDISAHAEHNRTLDLLSCTPAPSNKNNDINWQARELIAQHKPKEALQLLKNKRTVTSRQIKACAYAVLKDDENYLDQWSRIAKLKSPIRMDSDDWFYIEDYVWNRSDFWETFLICARQNRFDNGVFPFFDSIWDEFDNDPCRGLFNDSKAQRIRLNKRIALLSQYHISLANRDLKLAEKLLKRRPNWPEFIELKEKLSK